MSNTRIIALPPHPLPILSEVLLAVALTVLRWQMRRRTRHGLARLDTHLLRDIGLDPAAAGRECAKRFWQD